jgi:hypothetical protein
MLWDKMARCRALLFRLMPSVTDDYNCDSASCQELFDGLIKIGAREKAG